MSLKKLLYLHNSDINSEHAHLTQVISMCNAFKANNINVILVLNSSQKKKEQNALDTLTKNFGNLINFDIYLNNSMKAKYNRLGKYIDGGFYKKIIKEISPDICFVRAPLMMRACINANINYVYETHNNKMHLGYSFLSTYWTWILRNESTKERLQKIIAISDNLKKYWIAQGVDESKIIALHDGFSSKMFEKKISQEKARACLNLPLDKKIVLYSGSLFADREIDNIIALAENIPEAFFLVVGGPQKNAHHFQSIAELKNIRNILFVGRKPHHEIPKYLFASDVLLGLWSKKVPTINYCSPLKVFEYMAAGKIIVAHAFPTIKEVLRHNHNAILVEPDSVDDLICKIKYALTLEYPSSIAEQARRDVFEHYTWEQRAEHILSSITL